MSDEKNIRVNFLIDSEAYDKIKECAAKDDRSVSSFIRLAVMKEVKDVDQ